MVNRHGRGGCLSGEVEGGRRGDREVGMDYRKKEMDERGEEEEEEWWSGRRRKGWWSAALLL